MMLLQVEVLVVKTTYQNSGVTYVENYLGTVMLFTIKECLLCEGHWIFDVPPHAVQPGRLCMSIPKSTLA